MFHQILHSVHISKAYLFFFIFLLNIVVVPYRALCRQENNLNLSIRGIDTTAQAGRFTVTIQKGNHALRLLRTYAYFKQHYYNSAITAAPEFVFIDVVGKLKVEVEIKTPIQSFKLFPSEKKIKIAKVGNRLIFFVNNKTGDLCLEINGDKKQPLLLFIPVGGKAPATAPSTRPGNIIFRPGYHRLNNGMMDISQADTVFIAAGAVVEGALLANGKKGGTICGSGIIYNPVTDSFPAYSAISLNHCSKMAITGITILQRRDNWAVRLEACADINISGCRIISEIRDGLDIANTQRVNVSNCFIMAHDDAICLKGLAKLNCLPVEDIKVQHTLVANMGGGNAIEIGYESVTGIYQRISFRDIVVLYSLPNEVTAEYKWPEAALSIHPSKMLEYKDPAYMGIMPEIKNICYRNISIESCMDDYYIDISPQRGSPGTGISNILFKNIRVIAGPARPSRISKNKNYPLSNIVFRNFRFKHQRILNMNRDNFVYSDTLAVSFFKH